MQTLILVGGLGTRLRGISKDVPKPLVEIAGRPFLDYILLMLKSYGLKDITLLVGYQNEKIINYYNKNSYGLNLSFSIEEELLGTAGALKNAQKLINGKEFIMLNGDSFSELDYKGFINFAQLKPSLGTIAVKQITNTADYGLVAIDSEEKIVGFNEKTSNDVGYVNLGVYYLKKDILEYIPDKMNYSLEKELIPDLLQTGKEIYGFKTNCYFIDIGTPERYSEAQKYFSKVIFDDCKK